MKIKSIFPAGCLAATFTVLTTSPDASQATIMIPVMILDTAVDMGVAIAVAMADHRQMARERSFHVSEGEKSDINAIIGRDTFAEASRKRKGSLSTNEAALILAHC